MKYIYIISLCLVYELCGQARVPDFSAKNAFNELIKQCEFGPRDPGSEGHKKALEYYLTIFNKTADTTFVQEFNDIMPRTRKKVKMSNVIAQFNPKNSKQIMISCLLYTSALPTICSV